MVLLPPDVQCTYICPCIRLRGFALLCLALELSQLSCLRSSVGRASHLECVRRGFGHFSSETSCLRVCVVLVCLSIHAHVENTNGKEYLEGNKLG